MEEAHRNRRSRKQEEGAKEGNEPRPVSLAAGCEPDCGEDVPAAEQKAKSVELKPMDREGKDMAPLCCEESRKDRRRQKGQSLQKRREHKKKSPEVPLQSSAVCMVLASEVISKKRRDPLGVAKVYADDKKLQVHDDGDGGDPILPGKGECRPVEDDGGNSGCDLIHALPRTPRGCLRQGEAQRRAKSRRDESEASCRVIKTR